MIFNKEYKINLINLQTKLELKLTMLSERCNDLNICIYQYLHYISINIKYKVKYYESKLFIFKYLHQSDQLTFLH